MSWLAEKYDPEWPYDFLATRFNLRAKSAALLVIDLQAGDLKKDPDSEMGKKYPGIVQYWNQRMEKLIIPNTKRLIEFFRENKMRILYTRNGNISPSGDEMTARLRRKGSPNRYRGKPDYEIANEIFPEENDLVVDKLTASAFWFSILDHALRNMNITDVVLTGVLTDMCVFSTARGAAELGYNSLICEDACGTLSQRAHNEALLMHARTFGRVSVTEEVLCELKSSQE